MYMIALIIIITDLLISGSGSHSKKKHKIDKKPFKETNNILWTRKKNYFYSKDNARKINLVSYCFIIWLSTHSESLHLTISFCNYYFSFFDLQVKCFVSNLMLDNTKNCIVQLNVQYGRFYQQGSWTLKRIHYRDHKMSILLLVL